GIVQGEGEHAAQVLKAADAMFLVQVNDGLGVRSRPKTMAAPLQARHQLAEVVDLAVGDDDHGALLVPDGLGATAHIDDGEPPHSQAHSLVEIDAVVVGPPMPEAVGHGAEQALVAWSPGVTANAAHAEERPDLSRGRR